MLVKELKNKIMIKKIIYCLILSGFYCFSFYHADKNEKN